MGCQLLAVGQILVSAQQTTVQFLRRNRIRPTVLCVNPPWDPPRMHEHERRLRGCLGGREPTELFQGGSEHPLNFPYLTFTFKPLPIIIFNQHKEVLILSKNLFVVECLQLSITFLASTFLTVKPVELYVVSFVLSK
jgi:hypothetical protein